MFPEQAFGVLWPERLFMVGLAPLQIRTYMMIIFI
jgi:hypothetical protein